MDPDGPIIGIDLGTTNSVVAIMDGGQPRVIPSSEGSNRTPSVVAFMPDGKVVVGEIARRQAATNPTCTVSSVKRLMGRYYSEIQDTEAQRFQLRTDDSDRVLIDIEGVGYTPQQVSALILDKMKRSVEEYTGQPVSKAIITVPAYFDDLQRTATLEAGKIAGLEVLRLINEPTAAAMAYGLGQERDELVVVYDFGGGTFDVSILDIDDNAFEVLNCAGDTHLGGDDLDQILASEMLSLFERQNGFALELDVVGQRRLLDAAEKAKCDLSTLRQTQVSLPFLSVREGKPLHMELTIQRSQFEALIKDHVQRTIDICSQALREARHDTNDIRKVILVGGTTRIPLIQEMVEDFFGIQAFKGVNPDEIVALGAATQAGVLSGALREVVLMDVTPHSLGVEVKDGRRSMIVEKNSTIPIKTAKTFTTTEPNQNFVNIHILQGESEHASEDRSLGQFILSDIPAAPAGYPRIRVTFFINADGVLEVSATEMASGAQQSLTITHTFLDGVERNRRNRERKRRTITRPRRSDAPSETFVTGVRLRTKSDPIPPQQDLQVQEDSSSFVKQNFAEVSGVDSGTEENTSKSSRISLGGGAAKVPMLKISPTAGETRHSTGATSLPKAGPWSTEMAEARALLDQDVIDEAGSEQLKQAIPAFKSHLQSGPDFEARLCLAQIYLLHGMAEESRQTLVNFSAAPMLFREQALLLLGDLVRKFPNYMQARHDKAEFALQMDRAAEAIEDMEALQEQDQAQTEGVKKLAEDYRTRLEAVPDPSAQFKLVKIYLRLQKLDQGITLLRRLVKNPEYRDKALRVLGLCYWQKSMHEMAWQTLRELPPDPDLQDILYRLANDMESLGHLGGAREIFAHLESGSEGFRDVQARLRKIDFRLKLRKDQLQQTQPIGENRSELIDPRFSILHEINRGSMGIVYKARDKILDEIVALKILNDSLASDPLSVERFKQEARAAKRLSHPNIVRIHDFFESGNKKFLSMEFIEGMDVKRMLFEQGRLPDDRVRALMVDVLRAMDYAHRLGVVHRDIKPANIMLAKNDEVKVTDFGIAKILSSDDMTRANAMIVGTPLYMSPEQIEGTNIDARSDIYSLGITCYELLTGTPPFHDGNIEYHHIHTLPQELPQTISALLREFVHRCIEKRPEERFQSGREALDFLNARD